MNWSDEQQAIFDWFQSGKGSLVIKARAGTGKTTTIKSAFEHAPEDRILYAVFNKRNQKEAEEKITDHRVDVKTLHSLGYFFIKKIWSNAKPDDNVEYDRIGTAFRANGIWVDEKNREAYSAAVKLVSFAKNTTINTSSEELLKIIDEQDIDCSIAPAQLADVALEALRLSKEKDAAGRISFNDMVWLPVAMNWVRPTYDLVCVDEAQDMNLPQLTMARGAAKQGGRVVIVGDDRQAIYGFRGAVQNGMSMMKITLRAKELSLTTTYRCPKAVVKVAAEIVPDYKAHDSAPEGSVETLGDFAFMNTIKEGDAILSRMNAPLMPMALSLLRKNIPARIEGRDIGKQLAGMVRSMKAATVPLFVEKVEAWAEGQRERLMKARNAEKKIEQVDDIAQTLISISEGAESVWAIEKRLTDLFQDSDSNSRPSVVLSTVHKAKGLEWDNVYILRDSFKASGGSSKSEESNIFYVAVTRAKKSLYFVNTASKPASATSVPSRPEKPQEQAAEAKVEEIKAEPVAPVSESGATAPTGNPIDSYSLPAGMVRHEVGNVIKIRDAEYVCDFVNESRARFVCLSRAVKTVTNKLTDETSEFKESARVISISSACEPSMILRKETDFLSRKSRAAQEKQSSGTETESNMAKNQKKAKAASGGITGASEFVRKLCADGVSKTETYKQLIAKWPHFEKDKAGWESRWNMAEKIKAKAKAQAKEAAKSSKAPAKSSVPPKKKAAAAPPKRKAPARKEQAAQPEPEAAQPEPQPETVEAAQ